MAIQALNTIKKWFQTGLKPSQNQFWDTWDSFRHKLEKVPLKDVEELESTLNTKAEKSELDEHKNDKTAHSELFAAKEDKSQKGIALGYVPLDEFSKIAYQYLDIIDNLTSGGTTSMLSAQQGIILQNQIDAIKTLLLSDNPELDTFQKIVDVIEQIQTSLNTILVNDLTTGGITKALTAEMGKLLQNNKVDKVLGKSLIADSEITRLASLSNTVIATDIETQISTAITEDNKVVSRSKLFNWWKWAESTVLHKSGNECITGLKSITNTGDTDINGLNLTNEGGSETRILKIINLLNGIGYTLLNSKNGVGSYKSNLSDGVLSVLNSAAESTGDLIQFKKNNTTIAKFDQNGVPTIPYMIIPNGSLKNAPQNGVIERDDTGQLWETHNGVRSRLVTTADGLILMAYKSNNGIQTNITGTISATATNISSPTVIGNIKNTSVLRLNANNETYFYTNNPIVGSIEPIVAKTEVFLKINNGLFATNYLGAGVVNQVKIMEFSGLNNNGMKNYQNTLLTELQSSDPLTAQWSTIKFAIQNVVDGTLSNSDGMYYLRDSTNSRAFGASEASFSFVFMNTVTYADATNVSGQNKSKLIRNNNLTLYIETIK